MYVQRKLTRPSSGRGITRCVCLIFFSHYDSFIYLIGYLYIQYQVAPHSTNTFVLNNDETGSRSQCFTRFNGLPLTPTTRFVLNSEETRRGSTCQGLVGVFFLYCLLNYSYMQQHRTHNPQRVATPHLTVKVSHNNDRRGCRQKWQNAQYGRVVSHIILSSWRANGVEYYNAIRNKLYRTDYNVGIIMLCKL